MASVLSKICFLNPNRCCHSLQHFRQRRMRIEHSSRFPFSFRFQYGNRSPQSKPFHGLRRIKEVKSSQFSPKAPSSTPKSGLISWYLNALQTRPIATKSVTSALIYTAADVSSQAVTGELEHYDIIRTLRMAGYGMVILGPSLHYWYNFLSRAFPKRDMLSTLKKMVTGQTVYGPAMTATFFTVNAALQGLYILDHPALEPMRRLPHRVMHRLDQMSHMRGRHSRDHKTRACPDQRCRTKGGVLWDHRTRTNPNRCIQC